METSGDITLLLMKAQSGDGIAAANLMPLVYAELKKLAIHYMNNERDGHTLQPTALVNEAYIKLVDHTRINWKSRSHFIGVAAQLMRQVLIDHARQQQALKRGGKAKQFIELDENHVFSPVQSDVLLDLDDALERLATLDKRQCEIVTLRFFGGLSVEETAEVLGIAPRTVKLHWSLARAWLHREMRNKEV